MDLTKLMKGPAEAEPVQEQPKLSREEYAAQKKAEREELWTRIDALTVDAFKDGSSLRGFLDFTAQCSPERIENLLLFHSDAPEATWLKTFDEWKQAGRSVRGGEAGYTALCALPGFVDSKNEEKTERNAGHLVVSHSGGGMLRQGTRKGIRRTPANRGMRAHRIVKSLDISEDVCHGLCP